ncbi:MAG: NADH:flavin oxidoreductase, partial [Actinomycetota bacterium]|nr:NADH:flavin oxidoreductase [Actinomycetota bacterium]
METPEPPLAFRPIHVGTMELDHRLVVPPHSGGGGRLLESDEMFERHCSYWIARVKGGVQWVGGGPTFVRNPLIPGFEPTGVGSNGPGLFRHPKFVERMGEYMNRLHAVGGFGTVQFVLQGGMPIAPSPTLSGYADHRIPHPLDTDEIAWLIREYGESAALAAQAGADAIELHSNHDDVLQWFLSPLTNQRSDGYGGNAENRRRLVREIVEAIRGKVGRPITLGLRLCLDEMIEGGYDIADCQQLLAAFTADGTVDYFSLDVGGNWGAVSYIPPGVYGEAEWAGLCGQAKQATHLPVVYVGRVFDIATAQRVLADGNADLVGFARATIADPEIVEKTRR